jgi:hypothetical protein
MSNQNIVIFFIFLIKKLNQSHFEFHLKKPNQVLTGLGIQPSS